MIAYLQGRLAHKEPAFAIVDVNGVGYQVKISLNTFSKLGNNEPVKLHTYFMVKEDSQELYGFLDPAEKSLFVQLIGVSGVGGNTALTILSSISPRDLQNAIDFSNLAVLKSVKGIGEKIAGRIILELKGKLKTDQLSQELRSSAGEEAVSALVSLGFPRPAMEKRVEQILRAKPDSTVEEVIKLALKG